MTDKRTQLIQKFQTWLDTEPKPTLIASECANIAEAYALEQLQILEEIEVIDPVIVQPSEIEVGATVRIILTNQIGKAMPCNIKNHFRIIVGDDSAGVVPVNELEKVIP